MISDIVCSSNASNEQRGREKPRLCPPPWIMFSLLEIILYRSLSPANLKGNLCVENVQFYAYSRPLFLTSVNLIYVAPICLFCSYGLRLPETTDVPLAYFHI